ncbi:MAG: SGNH/GDSL hydrolase family protein [Acinetobacter populi]|jgi:lysophospholipase L1-like esterase|uniref:SGNH/GDSL hydrolase family protein n=1 Tax=Acinetobacter populi TaxID=1582270 RepID=UPI002357EE66|nr:SGNH/GDSL hydrolase family protein [Acinetobacter populi]MCH4249027.1 SGNH/GDSL hydrolase family protein [Acinetobacter populi]
MWLRFTTFALLPIIVLQGFKVRKTIPRLAEPSGEREGISGRGLPLSLLILGDSAAAGVGVDTQKQALSGAILTNLENEYCINWKLQAQTGHTSKQVLRDLQQLDSRNYDVIVTSVGVNDVTQLIPVKKWLKQQQQLFTQLQNRFQPKVIIVFSVPPMQHFPALPNPLAWLLGKYAKQMNQSLQQYLALQDQFRWIENDIKILQALNLPMARDGFHPDKEIYAFWGEQVANIIKAMSSSKLN